MQVYELRVISTDEFIRREETPMTLVNWQRKMERKLLRYQRTPDRVKSAIRNGDTIAGWVSYDTFVQAADDATIGSEIKRVLRGYDKFFEDRETAAMSAPLAKAA